MFDRVQKGMYWDKSWNPIRLKSGGFGCTKVSPGCANCWAERYSRRFFNTPPYDDRKRDFVLNEKVLAEPLRAHKPRVYFVCDLMDLFHKDVPKSFIDDVGRIIPKCPQHIFIILTKRPKRMRDYFKKIKYDTAVNPPHEDLNMPNIWLGVSVEDQKTADERIPILLQVPAAVRIVSIEPMLGAVNLKPYIKSGSEAEAMQASMYGIVYESLDWVICGGETGPGARPMNHRWVKAVKKQCVDSGVPFFFKSWGEWLGFPEKAAAKHWLSSDLHIWDDNNISAKLTKKKAGRLLDGREWNERPEMSRG